MVDSSNRQNQRLTRTDIIRNAAIAAFGGEEYLKAIAPRLSSLESVEEVWKEPELSLLLAEPVLQIIGELYDIDDPNLPEEIHRLASEAGGVMHEHERRIRLERG